MLQKISKADYQRMPWKNKKGTTEQIVVEPMSASLEAVNFHFRLSSAPIVENTVFSKFPGFQRILLPVNGRGFSLNGAIFDLHELAYFSGDEDTHCELLRGEVRDLGLIFNPQEYSATAKVLKFKNSFRLNKEPSSTALIYIAQGQIVLNDVVGVEQDTFVVTGAETLDFKAPKSTVLVLFQLVPTPKTV